MPSTTLCHHILRQYRSQLTSLNRAVECPTTSTVIKGQYIQLCTFEQRYNRTLSDVPLVKERALVTSVDYTGFKEYFMFSDMGYSNYFCS